MASFRYPFIAYDLDEDTINKEGNGVLLLISVTLLVFGQEPAQR